MKNVHVSSMMSPNYNPVPNQFVIKTNDGVYFQSYQSIIAFKDLTGKVTLGKHWDYSRTTGKYRNKFLGENVAETRAKIKSGVYTIDESL